MPEGQLHNRTDGGAVTVSKMTRYSLLSPGSHFQRHLPASAVLLAVAGDPIRKCTLTQVFQVPHDGSSVHQGF